MTGLVQDPAVFERFTEGIESGQYGTLSLPASTSTLNKQDAVVPDKNQILSQSDIKTLLAVYNKLSSLLEIASSNGVRIAFDAEQSWYQPALSRIVTFLAERFNRTSNSEEGGREPIVYNTYQANLKNTEKVILADLQRAKEKGMSSIFRLGVVTLLTPKTFLHLANRIFPWIQAGQRSIRDVRKRTSKQERCPFESMA